MKKIVREAYDISAKQDADRPFGFLAPSQDGR